MTIIGPRAGLPEATCEQEIRRGKNLVGYIASTIKYTGRLSHVGTVTSIVYSRYAPVSLHNVNMPTCISNRHMYIPIYM